MIEPYADAELDAFRALVPPRGEVIERMLATVDALKRDFQCVEEHATFWEKRAKTAEAERDRLREALKKIAIDTGCSASSLRRFALDALGEKP